MSEGVIKITDEMMKTLKESKDREDAFFKRHGVDNSHGPTGQANEAHRAWVKAVELEYKLMDKDSRVHLDMPISRKAFILGYAASKSVKP